MHRNRRASSAAVLLVVLLALLQTGAAAQGPADPALPAAGSPPTPAALPDGPCPLDAPFNSAADGWVAHTGTWFVGDTYLYTAGAAGTWTSASYMGAEFADLDYQARMWRGGCTTCASALVFRGTPDPLTPQGNWYNEYKLQYTADGYYSIWKRVEGGSGTAIVSWTATAAIVQGDAWNTLRVTAGGSDLGFYINGTLLWSGSDTSLAGGRVGFALYSDGTAGDELRVDWATLCLLPEVVYLPLVVRP